MKIIRIIAGSGALALLGILPGIVVSPSALAQADVSILYHEPLREVVIDRGDAGDISRLAFDAFGRRFVLPVGESRPGVTDPDVILIIASVEGSPGSWARLSLRSDTLTGLIHADDETWAVDARGTLEGELIVQYHDEATSPSIIYRLADTLVPTGLLACDTEHMTTHVDGKTAFASLTAELDTASPTADSGNDYRASVGVVADYSLFDRLGADAEATLEEMMLTVDGIYSAQVGIDIAMESITMSVEPADDPVSDTRVGSELLEQMAQWRMRNQTHSAITHLVTNRRLLNDQQNLIAGISYLGTPGRSGVCDARTGVSMSEWISRPMTALVIAHEIGHNFGAPHDGEVPELGETPNPCMDVEQDVYLMSPLIRSTSIDEFSQCSIEQMQRVIQAASCLGITAQSEALTADNLGGGGGTSGLMDSLVLLLLALFARRNVGRFRVESRRSPAPAISRRAAAPCRAPSYRRRRARATG